MTCRRCGESFIPVGTEHRCAHPLDDRASIARWLREQAAQRYRAAAVSEAQAGMLTWAARQIEAKADREEARSDERGGKGG
jgi:hypothetical protein